MMSNDKTILKKGTIVTLLTSYCEKPSAICTDANPCHDCIMMCNQFELLTGVDVVFVGDVDASANNTISPI